MGSTQKTLIKIYDNLKKEENPISPTNLAKKCNLHYYAAQSSLDTLYQLGIVNKTELSRYKIYWIKRKEENKNDLEK